MTTANGNEVRLQIIDDDDDVRNMEYDSSNDSENIDDPNIEGNIIMDAEGNYYYQSSSSVVRVEPLPKISGTPVKTVPAVMIPQNKRKIPGEDVNVHHVIWGSTNTNEKTDATTNSIKNRIEISEVQILETENDAKGTNETLTSEIDNQEKVYEFDENEQDPDDPEELQDPDYESKAIIKPAKKNSTTEAEQFSCMVCTYKTNKKFLLSRHLKTHCLERPYKCEVCERGFKTNSALMNHRNIHLGRKPHACSSCDKAFTTSGELVRHVRYRHTHIKPHKCTECDYSSVEMSKLRRHMRCHTGERPYQCPHCTYASPDTFKLKRHLRIHTGEKPYECDICHARFTQSNSLKHHRLIHSVSEKPVFQCHLCPTTCGRKSDLRLHIKNLHNSDQPIPCKRCGKELPDRYTYKLHVKTHEGEKCFRCEYCPYASISQRHLDTHVLIHLDAKPFECELCQSSFRQKQLYYRHKRIYHTDNYEPVKKLTKDHKCPHCDKAFAFNGNLIRHMEVHDPDSHRFEERHKLKLGRLTRVQPDGTVVAVTHLNKFTKLSDESKGLHNNTIEIEHQIDINDPKSFEVVKHKEDSYRHLPSSSKDSEPVNEKDGLIYAETEDEQHIEDEEIQEEEYEETDAFNEQYIYDEYECEEHVEEVQCEAEKEEMNKKPLLTQIKQEEEEQLTNSAKTTPIDMIKVEHEPVANTADLEDQDDQDYMILEVLSDDEYKDNEEQQSQEQQIVIHSKNAKPITLNKKTDKSKNNNNSIKTSQSLISDYFGFEDDEEDEETKGAIKILQMIENE